MLFSLLINVQTPPFVYTFSFFLMYGVHMEATLSKFWVVYFTIIYNLRLVHCYYRNLMLSLGGSFQFVNPVIADYLGFSL